MSKSFPDSEWQSRLFCGNIPYRDLLGKALDTLHSLPEPPSSTDPLPKCRLPYGNLLGIAPALLATYYTGHPLELVYQKPKSPPQEPILPPAKDGAYPLSACEPITEAIPNDPDEPWVQLDDQVIRFGEVSLFLQAADSLLDTSYPCYTISDAPTPGHILLFLWSLLRGLTLCLPSAPVTASTFSFLSLEDTSMMGPSLYTADLLQTWPSKQNIPLLLFRGSTLWALGSVINTAQLHLRRLASPRPQPEIHLEGSQVNEPVDLSLPAKYKFRRQEYIHERSCALPLSQEDQVTRALLLVAHRYPLLQYILDDPQTPTQLRPRPKNGPRSTWIHIYTQGSTHDTPNPQNTPYLSYILLQRNPRQNNFRLEICYPSALHFLFPLLEKVRQQLEELVTQPEIWIQPVKPNLPAPEAIQWNVPHACITLAQSISPPRLYSLTRLPSSDLVHLGGIARDPLKTLLQLKPTPLCILWEEKGHPRLVGLRNNTLVEDTIAAYIVLLLGQVLDYITTSSVCQRSVLHIHRLDTTGSNRWLAEVHVKRPSRARTQQYLCIYTNCRFTYLGGRVYPELARAIETSCFRPTSPHTGPST